MNPCLVIFVLFYFATFVRCEFSTASPTSDDKIVGGEQTDIRLVPYVLSYYIDGEYACSATIRNEEWAVTAAHCVDAVDGDYRRITVYSGSNYSNKSGDFHNVVEATVHEKYNSITYDYDVAVLRVEPCFAYDDSTQPVNIAQDNTAAETYRNYGVACGWGSNLITAETKILQCVGLQLIEKEECQKDYEPRDITPQMTCYGYQQGGKDTCQGDSGGGLVNKDNVLLGITSWGEGCALPFKPGVYADAVELRDWIDSKTGTSYFGCYCSYF